jgi:APA family basic amino acid/polyamine antiporter
VTAPARKIGLIAATALVLGNMVGSGVFLLPATLAPYGSYSLMGWVVSAIGALLLAGVFYRLARRAPLAGGPYAYSREAFGDCPGFLVAWVYWVAVVGSNAAIAVAFASYLSVLVPALATTPLLGALVALAVIWGLTLVNIAGIRAASAVQVATTILKLLPLIALAAVGLWHFDPGLLAPATSADTPLHAINVSVAATMFAFIGVECATIPAGHVRDAERTIPRATLLGTLAAAVVYIACTLGVMGVLPAVVLADSQAPIADAARVLWGNWAAYLIAGAAIISCFGALNGWTLIAGQFAEAVARDGLFPRFLAADSTRGVPVVALVVGATIGSVIVLANYSRGMVGMFTFIILLTTLGNVMAYLFSAVADVVLALRDQRAVPVRHVLLAGAAFAFTVWAVIGAGPAAAQWNLILLLLGLPLYAWQSWTRTRPT